MSVPTEADRYLDIVRENVASAVTTLSRIVIERVDGYDEYNATFKNTLKETLIALIEMREQLLY